VTTERRRKLESLKATLDTARQRHLSTWRELARYLAPYRLRDLCGSDADDGARKDEKILDETAILAVRTCKSGMMSGITTPARPWFGLIVGDKELAENDAVKDYLYESAAAIRAIFNGSNLYAVLPQVYEDITVFGTAAMTVMEDPADILRFSSIPPGSYWVGTDDDERIDIVIRQVSMTNEQIVKRWPKTAPDEIRVAAETSPRATRDVWHAVTKAEHYDPNKPGPDGMPWRSCWWTQAGDDLLDERGFRTMPILVPRWETSTPDAWGRGPGMDAIGSTISLQAYERKAHIAIDKQLDPALMGPSTLKQQRASLIPGDITWMDPQSMAAGGLRPIHHVQYDIADGEAKANQIRQRINRAFYADLFLMMTEIDRRQITATEIEERKQEKLVALGPLLQQLNKDLLAPLIERAYQIAMERGALPPPPPELAGAALEIDYLSLAAQAQKAAGMGISRAFMGYVAQAAQLAPEALDTIDIDEAIYDAADQLGINPKLVRDAQTVAAIRATRAQAQQAAVAQQQQMEQAKLAQTLATTPTTTGTALADVAALANGTTV
jgi:hypothetical protein